MLMKDVLFVLFVLVGGEPVLDGAFCICLFCFVLPVASTGWHYLVAYCSSIHLASGSGYFLSSPLWPPLANRIIFRGISFIFVFPFIFFFVIRFYFLSLNVLQIVGTPS